MLDVPHYELPEQEQGYYKTLKKLLDCYEDGWNFLINAHKAKSYTYPVKLKEEFKDDPYLPQTWLELCDAVCQIIAKEKYDLDVYDNVIEIIRPDQMLDAYTTNGIPKSYSHWSFGKQRMIEERKYDASKHLAYEIVINSDRCLAYCMEGNLPLLQLLVISHANYGHNAVFKNNIFLKEVDADTILIENERMRDFMFECEEKYGEDEVSKVLDFCHAMKFVDVTDEPKRAAITKEEMEAYEKELKEEQEASAKKRGFNENAAGEQKKPAYIYPHQGKKNILEFMADNAPHLPDWKRKIMRYVSRTSQYFRPQMMTKVLNEGMATFTHDRTMKTLNDIGMMDYGMFMEYKKLNEGVLWQQAAVQYMRDEDGSIIYNEEGFPEQDFVGASFNPYTLGLAILNDIVRICKNPTDEDREWFPHFAGNPDWLSVVKQAVYYSSDETYIEQYLSPKVMRDFKMFQLGLLDPDTLDSAERWLADIMDVDFAQITAVQNKEGFRKMRTQLARDYRTQEHFPDVRVHNYQHKTDRALVLRHFMLNEKYLDQKDTRLVLELMHSQWEHPVVIEAVNEEGEVEATYSSPPHYNHRQYTRPDMNPDVV
jgi:stage V sporulation protein R